MKRQRDFDEWEPPTKGEWIGLIRVLSAVILAVSLLGLLVLVGSCRTAAGAAPLHKPLLHGHRVVYSTVSGRQANTHVLTYAGFCASQRPALPHHSAEHPGLSQIAQGHAEYMARVMCQEHQNWNTRKWEALRISCCNNVEEICNESWPGVTLWSASLEAWKSWKTSPGHWSVANGRPLLYGAGIARGYNGVWYSCIVAAWNRGG